VLEGGKEGRADVLGRFRIEGREGGRLEGDGRVSVVASPSRSTAVHRHRRKIEVRDA